MTTRTQAVNNNVPHFSRVCAFLTFSVPAEGIALLLRILLFDDREESLFVGITENAAGQF